MAFDEIGRHPRQRIITVCYPVVFDRDVLTLDVAHFGKATAECSIELNGNVLCQAAQITNHRHCRLLRARRDRPRQRRASEQGYQLAPSYVGHGLPLGTRSASLPHGEVAPEGTGRWTVLKCSEIYGREAQPCKFQTMTSGRAPMHCRRSAAAARKWPILNFPTLPLPPFARIGEAAGGFSGEVTWATANPAFAWAQLIHGSLGRTGGTKRTIFVAAAAAQAAPALA